MNQTNSLAVLGLGSVVDAASREQWGNVIGSIRDRVMNKVPAVD